MGEARRRKLAGTYLPRTQGNRLSRDETIALVFETLANGDDPTVSGVTVIPADGSEPVYVSAVDAKAWPGGTRH
jgi:hypothetical protein